MERAYLTWLIYKPKPKQPEAREMVLQMNNAPKRKRAQPPPMSEAPVVIVVVIASIMGAAW